MEDKFIVSAYALHKAMSQAGKALAKKEIAPVLDGILLELTTRNLKLVASNLAQHISISIPVETNVFNRTVSLVVPRKVIAFLKALDDQPLVVTLNAETERISFMTMDASTTFHCLPAKDFVRIPEPSYSSYSVDLHNVDKLLKNGVRFVGKDSILQPQYCGIRFDLSPNASHLVALDGVALWSAEIDAVDVNVAFTVPTEAINLVNQYCYDILELVVDESKVRFRLRDSASEVIITSRLGEENYPDWHGGQVRDVITSMETPVAPLLKNTKAIVTILKDHVNKGIQLTVAGQPSMHAGVKASFKLFGQVQGPDQVVMLNAVKLHQIMTIFQKNKNLVCKVTSPSTGVSFQQNNQQVMLMPIVRAA